MASPPGAPADPDQADSLVALGTIPDTFMPGKPRTFRPAHLPSVVASARQYERDRGSARQRGYTAAWDVTSKAFRSDPDHALCVGCLAVQRVEVATVTDHIIPHRGDAVLFWDRSNWQGCCAPHHDVVKPRLEAMFDRGQIDAAGLRLDSPDAKRLTDQLLRP